MCFDVGKNGLIAIGSANSDQKNVSVYDATGQFQYGYSFYCSQSIGVQWETNGLMIYFVRSDVAALFDQNGINLELRMIDDTTENNSYWNHTVFLKEKSLNGNTYRLKNDMGLLNMFAFDYTQLIKTDPEGHTTVLYDAGSAQMPKVLLFVIAAAAFVALILWVLIRQLLKGNRNRHRSE